MNPPAENNYPPPLPPFGSHPLDNLVPSPSSDKENLFPEIVARNEIRMTNNDTPANRMLTLPEPQEHRRPGAAQVMVPDPLQLAFAGPFHDGAPRTPGGPPNGGDHNQTYTMLRHNEPQTEAREEPRMTNFLFGAMNSDLSSLTMNVRSTQSFKLIQSKLS